MKYQVGLFCILLSGQIFAINLSALLTDNNQTQTQTTFVNSSTSSSVVTTTNSTVQPLNNAGPQVQTSSNAVAISKKTVHPGSRSINLSNLPTTNTVVSRQTNKDKIISPDLLNSLIISDPDYQAAINVLYDQNNARIYDDYLQSINHSFMDYYLSNIQSVKIVKNKPKVIDLVGLENLSDQLVSQQPKLLTSINLSSLSDIVNVVHVSSKRIGMNLDSLITADNSLVTAKKPSWHDVNISGLQGADTTQVITVTPPSRSDINLSSLKNITNVEVEPVDTQTKKAKKKFKAVNLSSLLDQ